jgi:hypothetical protein
MFQVRCFFQYLSVLAVQYFGAGKRTEIQLCPFPEHKFHLWWYA